jgi:predicted nucleotide-binding protein
MSNPETDLLNARERLLQFADDYDASPETATLNELWQRAKDLGKSASGSWLGYQANVYYKNFEPPPAGDHFDIENGTAGTYFSGSNPNWIEHRAQDVMDLLLGSDGNAALSSAEQKAEQGIELLNSIRADVLSVITVYLADHDDSFVRRLADEVEKAKVLDAADIANEMSPKRKMLTRDMRAVQQGTWAPPHIKIQARVTAAHQPAAHCRDLAGRLEKLAAHLSRVKNREVRAARIGTNIFIGHGRSAVWRDLKDFVKDRLNLPYDEFNRVPVAGITNVARLSEMLDAAACAFVIMTAEDEQADGKVHARMNVIHEVGLFQGRLGFTKAIVLIEEGCEEFSNIQGLGQIRFPKGNISALFEEIRQVIEREGIIEPPR